jgi:anti-anti-sigma factor
MSSDTQNRNGGARKQKRMRAGKPEADTCIDIERSGEWMLAEELRDAAVCALEAGGDLAVNLAKIDFLDASALQILLALDAEQKKRGRHLQLVNVSPDLLQWFDFSGTTDRFFPAGIEAQ